MHACLLVTFVSYLAAMGHGIIILYDIYYEFLHRQ